MYKERKMNTNKLICPCCKYSKNSPSAKECELCGTSLKTIDEPKKLDSSISSNNTSSQTLPAKKTNAKRITRKYWRPIWFSFALCLALAIAGSLVLRESNSSLETQQANKSAVNNHSKLSRDSTEDTNSTKEQDRIITFADLKNIPQGNFWYGSSIPFSPLHTPEILNDIVRAFPNFKTIYKEPPAYTKPGSSTSVAMLLDGMVSFAELSRPLKDSEYETARDRGITLQQIPIASDGIVFFVHPSLPVDRLTIEQVRKMILGEITNWQQVGGPNLPVVPFVFDPKIAPSTLLLLFKKPELEQFSEEARYVRDYTNAIRQVSATPGGISYASAAIIANQRSVDPLLLARGNSSDYVNPFTKQRKINTKALQNGNYPLMRRFFIGVRRDGTIDEQAGLAYANIWLSKSGQELIEKAGFVPIKNP